MKQVRTAFLIVTLLSTCSSARDIYSLILDGQIDAARDSLSKLSTAAQRDGNNLFYLSLLERDAAKSVELIEAALNAGVSAIYREEINFRLSQYYLLDGEFSEAGKIIGDYLARFERGKHRPAFFRYSVWIDEESRRYESAIRQIDRYLLQYDSDDLQSWGKIDKARLMIKFDKMLAARDLLQKLSRDESGIAVSPSLYLLTLDAAERRRTDDAVFYYNLLKEAYPASIGLNALLDKMTGLGSSSQHEKRADRLTGTFYSVQVGVFSSNHNARRFARKFSKYGHKVEIKSKDVSNKTYRVVYVGRFGSYEEATAFEKQIEIEFNEVFQVVAR